MPWEGQIHLADVSADSATRVAVNECRTIRLVVERTAGRPDSSNRRPASEGWSGAVDASERFRRMMEESFQHIRLPAQRRVIVK